jgi:DDE superfamily endonuclease
MVIGDIGLFKLMRTLSKPSTAKCTLEHYTAFLLAEPQSAGCVRLAEVAGGEFAHDAANRFLNREHFSGKDLFEEAHLLLDLVGGLLSVDDTVLDKPYSQEGKTELVGYFWSGKHGRVVKGVCLVTLLYTDPNGVCLPVNFRLVDKAEGKTKNELFREMVDEVLGWGLRPALVSAEPLVLRGGKPQVPQEKGTGLSDWPGEEPHRQRTAP